MLSSDFNDGLRVSETSDFVELLLWIGKHRLLHERTLDLLHVRVHLVVVPLQLHESLELLGIGLEELLGHFVGLSLYLSPVLGLVLSLKFEEVLF